MLKNLSGLSLVILAITLPVAVCPAQEQPLAEPEQTPASVAIADLTIPELLMLADQYRSAKRFTDALNLVRLIVHKDENNIDALRLLGDIAWDMQNAEQAQKNWTLVRRIQPNDFGANWGLGRLNLRSGQYRNAMYYIEVAESVMPADPPEIVPQVLIALAQSYRGSGLRSQAVETIQKALTIDPRNFDAWYVLAALRTEMARSQEDFDQALGDADMLIEIADNLLKTNGTTLAGIQMLQTACRIKLGVLNACGPILFERNPDGSLSDRLLPGMEKLAANIFDKIVDVMMQQADLERTLVHFRIIAMAEKTVEVDGATNPSTLMKLGSLQVATGKLLEATETFQRVLALDPMNKSAQRQLDALQMQQPEPTIVPMP